jgi:hypothetical protein
MLYRMTLEKRERSECTPLSFLFPSGRVRAEMMSWIQEQKDLQKTIQSTFRENTLI